MTERQIQAALVRWFTYQYPKLNMLFFHIPNGGSRHFLEAVNLKHQGVKAGVSDLFLAVARKGHHGLFLELKSKKGKVSLKQNLFIAAATEQQYCCEVAYSIEQGIDVIKRYIESNHVENHHY